mmetsp:Transcript_26437/g.54758  ORF Transcript_26437/g.54758 Transcript_26437/m.54758 type:complete len:593 (+) Transcript_26437:19-1797(+)
MATTSKSAPIMVHRRNDSKYAQIDLWNRITGDTPLSSSPSTTKSFLLNDRHPLSHSVPVSPRHSEVLSPKIEDVKGAKETEVVVPKNEHPVPRYAAAQYGRTLHHPKLNQPTLEQEAGHLMMLAGNRLLNYSAREGNREEHCGVDDKGQYHEDLVSKLSKALLLGSSNGNLHEMSKDNSNDDNFSSPTSTLFFPDATFLNEPDESNPAHQNVDAFLGTCGLTSDELQQHTQQFPEMAPLQTYDFSKNQTYGELEPQTPSHSFVVCSDTQLGISSKNREWETELEYSRRAIRMINAMDPPPRFVCVCGDLIDMEYTFEERKGYKDGFGSKEECDAVQDRQNEDFQEVWSHLREDVAICCLCGNHDVGNRPTPTSIQRYKDAFGDEYLAFWVNGTYNIVLNNVLFVDPSGAREIFDKQLVWLEDRLKYAQEHDAKMIFVFGHHPWFLYDENETPEDLHGLSPYPEEWQDPSHPIDKDTGFFDAYFSIPKGYRDLALALFKKYGVNASFCGHFHQNVISKTKWGMDNIITAPLSVVFESSGKPQQHEENGRGIRIVNVELRPEQGGDLNASRGRIPSKQVRSGGTISHYFLPLQS